MLQIAGIACVFIMVFGGYLIHGGSLEPIIHAAPFELIMILGAGVGAFLLGSSGAQAKAALGSFGKVFGGPKWKKQDYRDLLSLLFTVTKTMKSKGMIALEPHIENPNESAIFKRYPKILHDHFALDFICDTLRMMTMSLEDPHQVETAMEKQLEKHHHESSSPAEAMQSLADGLPAFGIVAAVLGVVNTMGSVGQPPAVLGGMIGSALVGTFLGILLAYGFAEPLAGLLEQKVEDAGKELQCIKTTLLASMQGYAPQVAIEFGRKVLFSGDRPSFAELEGHVKGKK